MTVSSTSDTSAAFLKTLQSTSSATDKTDTKAATGTSALGKDSFLQLLVTQMKNQNPLDPQDNTAFVAQLAQFSSLETMQNLSSTVTSISSQYQSSQALQASALVGRSVTVAAGSTYVDTSKAMTGSVVVPASSSSTTVAVKDATGSVIRTLDLGSQAAGTSSFSWDGKDDTGATAAAGTYSFVAQGYQDGKNTALATNLPATVSSVTMGTGASGITLNLAGGSSVALANIKQIGI